MSTLDYSIFAHPSFDANEYANAILASQPYRISSATEHAAKPAGISVGVIDSTSSNKEEISVALAKLSFGIEDVNRQLKNVINVHHEALLAQAASVNQLEGSLQSVNGRLKDISGSVNRLRAKLSTPYAALNTHAARLQKLQLASGVLRRVARFFMLSRRLEAQMALINQQDVATAAINGSKPLPSAKSPIGPGEGDDDGNKQRERAIIKAALSIAEIVALIDADTQAPQTSTSDNDGHPDQAFISLSSLSVISDHLPIVQGAKDRVMNEMEAMMVTGIQELDQSLLSSALLTAHNLRVLPEVVQNLINDLVEVVEVRIKTTFDMAALGRDKSIQEITSTTSSSSSNLLYKSRVRTEPTNLTAPQWTAALWTKLEAMITEISGDCIKVYTLEKVLNLQKDTMNGRSFLDEAMTLLENKPSSTFWAALARTLERSCRDGSKTSAFLLQTLTSQYPRLLRLFQDFFSRISVHTDTLYTQAYQSPETVLTLRSVSIFESAYLQRSTTRLNELVSSSFATSPTAYFGTSTYTSGGYMSSGPGGGKPFPGEKDGISIARVIMNELDTAKFDPLLVKSSARGMAKGLEMLCTRAENLAARDRSSTTLVGPTATVQQHLNASLVNAMYHCWLHLLKLPESYSEGVSSILQPAIDALRTTYLKITDPLLSAIRLDASSIINRVHRLNFADKSDDPMSHGMGASSLYIQELAEKLAFVRVEILSKYNVGELGQQWCLDLARHLLRTFVLHVSIIKPLGESGKMQLISDIPGFEFAIDAMLREGIAQGTTKLGWKLDAVGMDYFALKAFRQLLFSDNEDLAKPERTNDVPSLIVLHHILVRSPLPLPHELHGWQESQYVRFIEEHTDDEVLSVLEQGLKHWRAKMLSDIEDADDLGPPGNQKKQEKERELNVGETFVALASKVLQNARMGL